MNSRQLSSNFNTYKTKSKCKLRLTKCLLFLVTCSFSITTISAQKLAFLAPDKSLRSNQIREQLEENLSKEFNISDNSLAEIVFDSTAAENIFNLSDEEARNLGKALGCNFFVLVKSETLRRTVLANPDFYIESYAVVYLVSARTGHLIFWKLESVRSSTAAESEKKLSDSLANLATRMSENIKSAEKDETAAEPSPPEEIPEENSTEAKDFRVPLPYRRFKPEYTAAANFYGITATVDSLVDLDESGKVTRIEITRWAGYGLDESVTATIRKMQWRAAERNGKQLPIRVLLRYNFKKIDTDNE